MGRRLTGSQELVMWNGWLISKGFGLWTLGEEEDGLELRRVKRGLGEDWGTPG